MFVKNAQTDVTTYFVLRDATTHAPKADVTITDIDVYYVEELAAISAKADLTALAAADSAHADNKGFHVGQGLYRIDWPDEAFNGGIGKKVELIVVCSGVDTTFLEVYLSAPVDAVAISGDDVAADNLEKAADGTGYNLGFGSIVAASVTAQVTADAVKISGSTTAADKLEASALGVVVGTAITGTLTTTAFTTSLTEATSDHYNGRACVFTTGVLAGQARSVLDYDGSTKTLTTRAFTEAPSNLDAFVLV